MTRSKNAIIAQSRQELEDTDEHEADKPRSSVADDEVGLDDRLRTYCICDGPEYGDMIACDDEHCSMEWFHLECVGLKHAPKGKWKCPECRKPGRSPLSKNKAMREVAVKKSKYAREAQVSTGHPRRRKRSSSDMDTSGVPGSLFSDAKNDPRLSPSAKIHVNLSRALVLESPEPQYDSGYGTSDIDRGADFSASTTIFDLIDRLNLDQTFVADLYAQLLRNNAVSAADLGVRLGVDPRADYNELKNLRCIFDSLSERINWRTRLANALSDIGRVELSQWVAYGLEELLAAGDLGVDVSRFAHSFECLDPSRTPSSRYPKSSPILFPKFQSADRGTSLLKNVVCVAFCSKYIPVYDYVQRFLSDDDRNNLIYPLILNDLPVPPHNLFLRDTPIDRLFQFISAEDLVEAVEDGFCAGLGLTAVLEGLFNGSGYVLSKYVVVLVDSPALALRSEYTGAKDGGLAFSINDDWCAKRVKDVGSDIFLSLSPFECELWKVVISPTRKPWFSREEMCLRNEFPSSVLDAFIQKLVKANLVSVMNRGVERYFFRVSVPFNLSARLGALAQPTRTCPNARFPEDVVHDALFDVIRASSNLKKDDARLVRDAFVSELRSIGVITAILPPISAINDGGLWYRLVRSPFCLCHLKSPRTSPWEEKRSVSKVQIAYLFKFDKMDRKSSYYLFSLLTNDVYQFCMPSTVDDAHQVYGERDGVEILLSQGVGPGYYGVAVQARGPTTRLDAVWAMLVAFEQSLMGLQRRYTPQSTFSTTLVCPKSLDRVSKSGQFHSVIDHEERAQTSLFGQLPSRRPIQCPLCGSVDPAFLDESLAAHSPSSLPPPDLFKDAVKGGAFGKVKELPGGGAFGHVEDGQDGSHGRRTRMAKNGSSPSSDSGVFHLSPEEGDSEPESPNWSFEESSNGMPAEFLPNPGATAMDREPFLFETSFTRRYAESDGRSPSRDASVGRRTDMRELMFVGRITNSIGYVYSPFANGGGTCYIYDVENFMGKQRVRIRTTMHMVVAFCQIVDRAFEKNGPYDPSHIASLLQRADCKVAFDYHEPASFNPRYRVSEVASSLAELERACEDNRDLIDLFLVPIRPAEPPLSRDVALRQYVNTNGTVERERYILIGHSDGLRKTTEVALWQRELKRRVAQELLTRTVTDPIFQYDGRSASTRELVEIEAAKGVADPMDEALTERAVNLIGSMSARDAFLFFQSDRVLVVADSRVQASGSPMFARFGDVGPFELVARYLRGFPESARYSNNFIVEQAHCMA